MVTRFIGRTGIGKLGFILALAVAGLPIATLAVEVNVVGLFPDKALVEINGGKAQVLTAGQISPEGVKLISARGEGAVFEIEGKRRTLQLGQSMSASFASSNKPSVTLVADGRGHFVTSGTINGAVTRFLIDTGATTIAMGTAEARRLGINYLQGEQGSISTAGGVVSAYRVTLDRVKVGEIVLDQVACTVIEGPTMAVTLLGMSFLNRVEMKRDGSTLTLIKNY
jgi:aspartyl protease family protein